MSEIANGVKTQTLLVSIITLDEMPVFYEEDTHLITVSYWSVATNKKIVI